MEDVWNNIFGSDLKKDTTTKLNKKINKGINMETNTIKLNIKLEPWNGNKFDFIEIKITEMEEINTIYNQLDAIYGERKQINASTQNDYSNYVPAEDGTLATEKQINLINNPKNENWDKCGWNGNIETLTKAKAHEIIQKGFNGNETTDETTKEQHWDLSL